MGLFGNNKPFIAKCRKLMPDVMATFGGGGSGCDPNAAGIRIAVFGDIHANREAFQAVLDDAKERGVNQFACTGDIVGYGPNPSECISMIRELECPVVKGNHDEYTATDCSLKDVTFNAMNALLWTREHLSAAERAWLDRLPMEWGAGSKSEATGHRGTNAFHVVHSSVFEPERWRYIIKQQEAEKVLPLQQADLVFFGHTHMPSVYGFHPDTGSFTSRMPSPEGVFQLEDGWRWLANPGSVGQPRDYDPRAAYIIYDPAAGTLEQRRVEYDFRQTAKKIVAAGLPERNAQRLYEGR